MSILNVWLTNPIDSLAKRFTDLIGSKSDYYRAKLSVSNCLRVRLNESTLVTDRAKGNS
jgi:hypothetical protein